MNWLQRYERLQIKKHKAIIKRDVRAYRQRQQDAGIWRIDVSLTEKQSAALLELMLPGETISNAVGRLLDAISGNTHSA